MTTQHLPMDISNNNVDNLNRVRNFYDHQILANPDMPAILGFATKLAVDFRDWEEWRTFQRLVSLASDMSIIELGCGGGRWCEHFSGLVKQVIGVDLSGNAIAHAQHQAEIKQLRNITYYLSSLEQFRPEGLYDLIYFSGVALYMGDQVLQDCIERYSVHLHDKGLIVVRESLSNKAHCTIHEQGYTVRYRTVNDFEASFERIGFKLVNREMAFPLYCLSPTLCNPRISGFYKVAPTWLKRIFLKVFSLCAVRNIALPHWCKGGFTYGHTFLVFSKM